MNSNVPKTANLAEDTLDDEPEPQLPGVCLHW